MLVVLLVSTLAARSAAAQGTITGRVTATASGQPLADTRVLILGGNAAATTNEDGRFALRGLRPGIFELQVLHVGYQALKKTVTVAEGGTTSADFQLTVTIVQLQEIVTTATGQQRRVELGNAISTLGDVGKRVEEGQVNSLQDLLVAKAPGVVVLPGVMTGGAPTVRIRGLSSISLTNAPIYIVDGTRYESSTTNANGGSAMFSMLNSLSPDEIEDVEIVKGPSAATLYGTNASNGVVVITTKRGRAGNTRWTWIGELGRLEDRNPYQTMYANWGHAPGTTTPIRCKLPTMGPSTCISDSLTSYNLMKDEDRTFVHPGSRNMYGVNVSGGTEAVRFFVSGQVDNEIGPIQMPAFEIQRFESANVPVREEWMHPEAQQKLNFRANLNAAVSPKLDLTASVGFGKVDNRLPPSGAAFEALYYVGLQNYGFKGPGLDKALNDSKGTPLNEYFQYAPGDVMQRFRPQDVQRTTASINANWRTFPWLQTDGTMGMDLVNRDNADLCRLNECAPTSITRQGRVNDNRYDNRNFTVKLASTATWNARSWANLKTTVGVDYANLENDSTGTSGTVLPPGASTVAAASTRDASALWPTAQKTLGFYVQEQAGLNDRLFLTVAARSDQNSAFGTKFQNVLYPKAGLSWIVSEESFFPRWSWMNQFRLRSSYGASGVQPGRTDALVTFSAGAQNLPNRGTTAGADVPGLAASQTGNPELKPETSAEWEGGFETQLLNSRIHLDYVYYDKRTKDALINVDKAPSSAAAQLSPLINIGRTRNWGHEVTLSGQIVETRRFGWDVTLNGSHASNAVLDLGIDPVTNKPRIINPGAAIQERAGYPINSRWYRGYSFTDANKDGIIQPSEVKVDTGFAFFGYSFPRDIFSVSNGIDLLGRKLRITAFFDYKGGWALQDGGNNFQCNTGPFACRETEDPTAPLGWQARNVAKSYGSVTAGTTYKTGVGYIQNGQFWKFREFSAAYTLPNVVISRLRAQNGSTLVLGIRNIHTWSNYTGIDPEEHDNVSDNQSNFQSAPPPTYFTFRLNLKY
jgi:TonB-linked SusC/RagA family outer membrane protein